MKKAFVKNLFQMLSFIGSILVIEFPLVYGLIVVTSLNGFDYKFCIFLGAILGLPLFAFFVGFYWIFQKVIIDENGVTVYFLKKFLKTVKWKEVLCICYDNRFKNPEIKILGKHDCIHLDKRKMIIKAINEYSKTHFGKEINHL